MTVIPGRVALVTGANKGIGYHIAAQLIASGVFSRVVLGCRDLERGRTAARELGGNEMVDVVKVDVADLESCAACPKTIESRYGRLDVLVNNAGLAFKAADPTPFEGQTGPTLQVRCTPYMRSAARACSPHAACGRPTTTARSR